MGDAIKFVQTATISSGGTYEIVYTHDPRGKPSRVGLIAARISAGTQTGIVSIRFGNDPTNMVELERHAFTASNPSVSLDPSLVLYPGQVISFHFSTITAGDTIVVAIGGH